MKVAIVGCGALGSYYGARLCRAGHETHFLLRSDFASVARDGVQIVGLPGTEAGFQVRPHCADRPSLIGPSDLVLIGLKTTANAALADLLPPLCGPGTAVFTLQNGLGNEAFLERLVPPSSILGGLAYVSLNRLAPGVVRCQDPGSVVLGEWSGPWRDRTRELTAALNAAGVATTATDHLRLERWRKLVWNIPFNGLGTLGAEGIVRLLEEPFRPVPTRDGIVPTDQLLAEPRWRELVRDLMLEVLAVARSGGHDLPDSWADSELARTRVMGSYKPSTTVDFELGRPLELEAIFGEPFRQAQASGVPIPWFTRLIQGLRVRAGWSENANFTKKSPEIRVSEDFGKK